MKTAEDQRSTPSAPTVGTCPLCGGAAELAFTTTDRNRELSAARFRYRRCRECACLSLVDVPEDLGAFYPQAYYQLPDASQLDELIPVEAHKVAFVADRVAPGRLVEIGPGEGVFAHAARRAGFDVTAIEMDARACEHLRTAVGVAAINSDDPVGALAALPPSRAVAMWHVIEHLPDPWATLEAAAANLEPGGLLALATPNPDAIQARLLRGRWAHVDAPRHLFLLPLAELTRRAAAAGLRRVAVTTSDPGGRHWNLFGWERALRRRPASGPAPAPVALAALAMTLVLRPIEHSGVRGAAYMAAFVKEGR